MEQLATTQALCAREPRTRILQPARRVCPWCLLAGASCGVPTLRDGVDGPAAPRRSYTDCGDCQILTSEDAREKTAREVWDAEVEALADRFDPWVAS